MNARLLLILSVCLNLALGSFLVYKAQRKAAPAQAETPPQPDLSAREAAKPDGKTVTVIVPEETEFDWRIVESEDYKNYIANLRAIGCPEETIRDIIIADVNKLFEARKKELTGSSTKKFEYWKTGTFFTDMFNEDKLQKHRALAKEKQVLLKELLGVEVAEKPDIMGGMNPYETLLDFLPPERHAALMNLEQDFAAKMMKRMKDARGNPNFMRELQAEKDAELAKVLSPQEKEEYDLRMSQSAMVMRMTMSDFQPTEQEFRDIFQARKKFDDEFGVMGSGTSNKPEERERREAAQKELDSTVKSILGEDRFREYKYDQDWSRSSLRDVAKEHNIPKEQAFKVFEIKAAATEQVATLRRDQSLTAEQRKAALDAIQQETRNAVNGVLGSAAGEAYFTKGSWLKNLNRTGQNTAD